MKIKSILGASILLLSVQVNAALLSRLDGAAAYDDVLDITWITNAGLSGVERTWDDQMAWADGLNYLGFNEWRLASYSVSATGPTFSVVDCSSNSTEEQCRDNELEYMFYYNLNGSYGDDLTGNQTVGDVILTNIQSNYWSNTEIPVTNIPDEGAYGLSFDSGYIKTSIKNTRYHGWAVHDGDIGVVPVTAAIWLFGTALIGLVGFGKRRAAA